MKILHTSDWHLGHTMGQYAYDRIEEQRSMLRQMADIVREEKPDLFLLCGDVYHTPQPSAAVQTLFSNALVEIHDAHPAMTIVITAGNHDSGTKHEIFRTPWQALKVHTIGMLNKEKPDNHIIEIPGKGYVVALPYTYERNIPEGFFQQLLDRVAERNTEALPVVMTAHTTVRGCDITGHDRNIMTDDETVGGIEAIGIEQMGEGFDYLALGHIHHEQFIHTGNHNVRYCGTPLPVSFDENYPHSVSLVEIGQHGQRPEVKKIEIDNPHPLVTLPTDGLASWTEAKQLLADFPDDIAAYIRLNVEIEDFLPVEANNEAIALTQGKRCRFCGINAQRKRVATTETKTMSLQEFQAERPISIALRFASDLGITFDDEMCRMFEEVAARVEQDKREK